MIIRHPPIATRATLAILGLIGWLLGASEARAQLRICNYNVTASDSSLTSPRPGVDTILSAIGSSAKGGFSRPVDVLVLLEANSVSTTGVQFATLLNTIYGGTNYRQSALNGGSTGAGRPICVYNAATVSLVNEKAVGITSSTGQPRQTLRYQFQPVGYDSNASFSVYASHFKASNSSSDAARRNVEARAIRADLDALGDGRARAGGRLICSDAAQPRVRFRFGCGGAGLAVCVAHALGLCAASRRRESGGGGLCRDRAATGDHRRDVAVGCAGGRFGAE